MPNAAPPPLLLPCRRGPQPRPYAPAPEILAPATRRCLRSPPYRPASAPFSGRRGSYHIILSRPSFAAERRASAPYSPSQAIGGAVEPVSPLLFLWRCLSSSKNDGFIFSPSPSSMGRPLAGGAATCGWKGRGRRSDARDGGRRRGYPCRAGGERRRAVGNRSRAARQRAGDSAATRAGRAARTASGQWRWAASGHGLRAASGDARWAGGRQSPTRPLEEAQPWAPSSPSLCSLLGRSGAGGAFLSPSQVSWWRRGRVRHPTLLPKAASIREEGAGVQLALPRKRSHGRIPRLVLSSGCLYRPVHHRHHGDPPASPH
nr:uncharacterized protein LOC127321662 [Lolium perenne]XP_051206635.1 uncharacterized protein LOC127321662 [Lolium perenne]XP_051206636.1 uncharacterized protein LOC127321662 [Lolium perenne]XP_051206637.1 uncharacterized protein LOC127321662 [Lolium perenne]XP_051206638.1 uncharacterized protein LOC127321662 [Lolium perenne]